MLEELVLHPTLKLYSRKLQGRDLYEPVAEHPDAYHGSTKEFTMFLEEYEMKHAMNQTHMYSVCNLECFAADQSDQ